MLQEGIARSFEILTEADHRKMKLRNLIQNVETLPPSLEVAFVLPGNEGGLQQANKNQDPRRRDLDH